ncbi:MAG: sensor histidine kinase [Chloroflexi bacterium]|nr:MAG: sensor histidine kinase [Chloroflexota bacterium]
MEQVRPAQQPVMETFGHSVLRNRRLVFVAAVVSIVLLELIEHWPIYDAVFNVDFWQEIAIYGLIIPFVILGLLTLLARASAADIPIERIQAEASRAERQRIARDLHDKLGQNLAYLHFKLDQLSTHADSVNLADIESIQADLEHMRQVADLAYGQIRGTLDNLRNEADTPENLAPALQQQAKTIGDRNGLDIQIDVSGAGTPICRIVQRTILNIAHESLTNAGKHAQAGTVNVRLSCNQNATTFSVTDDGTGFETSTASPNGHYGLKIMRERAEEVGGRLEVKSSPGNGTQIIGHFPNAVVNDALLATCSRLQCEYVNQCAHEYSSR